MNIFEIQQKMLSIINEHNKIEREKSIEWEIIHMISCATIGRNLAVERGVDPDLAVLACSIHDYGRILTGKIKNHAELGYEPVKGFLSKNTDLSTEKIELVAQAVKNHSKKSEIGTPLEEIVKDADVLTCHMYGVPLERAEQTERLRILLLNESV